MQYVRVYLLHDKQFNAVSRLKMSAPGAPSFYWLASPSRTC